MRLVGGGRSKLFRRDHVRLAQFWFAAPLISAAPAPLADTELEPIVKNRKALAQ
jgi:hypothetical protein